MKKILVLLVLAAASYFAWMQWGPKKPEFKRVANAKITSVGADMAQMSAEAIIFNPNVLDIQISDIDLDVAIEGKPSGKAKGLGTVIVAPAGEEFSIPVKVDVNIAQVMEQHGLLGMLSVMGGKPLGISFKGKVKASAMGISFEVPVSQTTSVQMGK